MGCAPPVFRWMISKNMFKLEFLECDLAVLPQSQEHASLPGADPQPGHLPTIVEVKEGCLRRDVTGNRRSKDVIGRTLTNHIPSFFSLRDCPCP